jgi:hypothetical protein
LATTIIEEFTIKGFAMDDELFQGWQFAGPEENQFGRRPARRLCA